MTFLNRGVHAVARRARPVKPDARCRSGEKNPAMQRVTTEATLPCGRKTIVSNSSETERLVR
ncbi:Hypothetical protein I596_1128 [Dokdonella koreensis DS-123]|uniref:Uncharacterized protein n=1 Tax=Dokdonella koreensis DS-123 TaxID=1300342 RepID=A0A160DSA6_9GAMM|nr:Hypothetical protein I596_1128 [Dokdonella koreensis DS-123]